MATQPLSVPSPAFFGLAKQHQQSPLGPEWAVKLKNIVVDSSGRLAARKGWNPLNAVAVGSDDPIIQLHEYVQDDGTSEIISATADDILTGTSSPTSIVGALTPAAGNWQFVNFNGYCLAWQDGEDPIEYNGSGDFAAITATSGSVPTGNCALAAFGRVWACDTDKQTIKYSALLDHTKWAAADGAGLLDMRKVWTLGMDEVVGLMSYGSSFVVFGRRHIVIWVDGAGSDIGLSPTNMYVTTVIEGVGLVARDAVTSVGEIDVAFWSPSGVRSLSRTQQERATPVNELSPDNRDYLASALATGDLTKVRMEYSATEGLILMSHPDYGKTFVFDTRQRLQTGGYRMTEWTLAPTALEATLDRTLLFGMPGHIGQYADYDDNEESYQYEYETGWMPIRDQNGRLQALKALKAFMSSTGEATVTFRWWVDFRAEGSTATRAIGGNEAVAEYGIAEFGIGEFGAGEALNRVRIPLSKEAEYLKLAVLVTIDGGAVAVQPLTIYSRPTRLA